MLHGVPYEDLWGSLSLFAWLVGLIYLGLELVHRGRSVGPFVLPFVIILFSLSHIRNVSPHPTRSARRSFRVAHYAQHFGVFGFCAGRCAERDFSVAESFAAPQKTGRSVLAIPGTGRFGAHEPKQRFGGIIRADCGQRCGIDMGASIARTVLERRSEGSYLLVDGDLLRGVFTGFAADGVARRACGDVLHD